ncbi:MAG: YidC/Oxa1 family membrane protein insertase [Clostridia bacterium]|nr:YidC/Oxa1 family membrane protein insertase [Clostridia bacterium]
MFDFIIKPIGSFFLWMYNTIAFQNYGLAIVYFTVIVQLLMIPLTIKRCKSTILMQKINPQLQHIQKKYANDQKRMQEEQQKLYDSIGYNPMSGCGPLFIQLPVIMILWQVIGSPLKYVFNWSTGALEKACTLISGAVEGLELTTKTAYYQITIMLHKDALPAEFFTEFGIENNLFNMDLFGMNLGRIPDWHPDVVFGPQWKIYLPLFILAIASAALSFFMNKINMKSTQGQQAEGQNQAMNGCMSIYLPLISLLLAFKFPVGLSIYWMTSTVVSTGLQLVLMKYAKAEDAKAEIARQQELELKKQIIEEQNRAKQEESSQEEKND